MAVLYTQHFVQFFDDNGDPLSNGKLYSYAAGTTTPKATYTTAAGDVANANPVILDSAGRAKVFLVGSYKFTLTDSNDAVIETTDNVSSFATTADEADAFFQSFSGNGTQTAFTLSESLGTDEKTIMVFINNDLRQYVTNGTFDTDTNWTKGSGWTIGSGIATAVSASADLTQTAPFTLEQGSSYTITYTITRSAGNVHAEIGGTVGVSRNSDGTYTETIVAGSTQDITFTGSNFSGTVDNVTIKVTNGKGFEIQNTTQYTLSDTTLTIASPPAGDTNNMQVWAPARLAGAASASAAAAELSATQAEVFKDAAEAAQVAAELAETNAETAETNAETAAVTAEAAAVTAEAAAVTAIAAAGMAAVGNLNSLVVGTPEQGDFVPFVDINDSNIAKKVAIGKSGATVPLLNSNNTLSGDNTHSGTNFFTGLFKWRQTSGQSIDYYDRTDDYSDGSIIMQSATINKLGTFGAAIDTVETAVATGTTIIRFLTNSVGSFAQRFAIGLGFYANGLSDMGAGTVNATGLFVNGADTTSIGIGQTWQNLTGSRVTGTSYTNSTGRPIMVHVNFSTSSTQFLQVSVDGVTWIRVGGGQGFNGTFIVPNNHLYRLAAGTIVYWGELR